MFGLEATGVADPETRELLSSSSNVIFGVQTKLIELAYLTGVADGVLGPATETAISEFQQMHGLEATGVADPETRELLQSGTELTIKPTPTPSPRAHGAQGHGYRACPAAAGRVGLPRRHGGRPLRRRYRGRREGIQDLPV